MDQDRDQEAHTPLPSFHRSLSISTVDDHGQNRKVQLWEELTQFYNDNEESIRSIQALDLEAAANDDRRLRLALESFVENTKIVLDGLVCLGNVHPILGVAIFALHSVISLELTRRDNDRKVVVVKLQMQNLMCSMFQLKDMKHTHVQEPARVQQEARLQELIKVIASDITRCGSDLNSFMNRKRVSKIVHAKGYEQKFAEHIANFIQRRSELQIVLTAYIAASVDHVNTTIDNVAYKVDDIDKKLNTILTNLFPKLNTAHEGELYDLIDKYGGSRFEEFLKKDDLLTELYEKATISEDGTQISAARQRENLKEFKNDLKNELDHDLNDILAANFERFERLLTVQNKNNVERLSSQMQQQGNTLDTILTTMTTTSLAVLEQGQIVKKTVALRKEKLHDPEFQKIWDQMRLGRNVKAKTFVLTFRDHFLVGDRSMPGTPHPVHPSFSDVMVTREPASSIPSAKEDRWVFDYIDVTHVQPIVEAMDEDGSGFISVMEANKFASSRPKGMSLLHWIAYWAAGWHINVTYYYHRIYTIMVEMHNAFKIVLWANQPYVDKYLNSRGLLCLEGTLRSIKPLPNTNTKSPELAEIVEILRISQEDHILANLKEMSFLLQSPADIAVVAGAARAETWFLPLTYLLLRRHFRIILLSQNYLITEKELQVHAESLDNVLKAFNDRMRVLESRFEQIHRDVERQFSIHAYGMFLTSFKNTTRKQLPSKLLAYKKGTALRPRILDTSDREQEAIANVSVLNMGVGVGLSSWQDIKIAPPQPPLGHESHPIEGFWMGVCYLVRDTDNRCLYTSGCFEALLESVVDSKIIGTGVNANGRVQIAGTINKADEGDTSSVSFTIISKNSHIRCTGTYDPASESIRGYWSWAECTIDGEMTERQNGGNNSKDASASASAEPTDISSKDSSDDTYSESDIDVFQSEDSDHLQDEHSKEFILTRTPKDVYRFRYLIDYPGRKHTGSLTQRRWSFAIAAVLCRVRRTGGFSNAIKTGLAERVKWIKLSIRYRLFRYYSSTEDNLSGELIDELLTLMWRVPPENALIYQSLTTYYFSRVSYERYVYCYSCSVPIHFTRFICITCVKEEFDDQIVLCPECIRSRKLTTSTFTHSLSHCLICSPIRIHCYELPEIIFQARRRSQRIIAAFKNAEAKVKLEETKKRKNKNVNLDVRISQHHIDPDVDLADNIVIASLAPLACACCSENLTLPFWACVTCERDTLFCLTCEPLIQHSQTRYHNQENHTYKHALLLITFENKISADSQNIRLEKQMTKMGERIIGIQSGMDTLEQSVNTRLDAIQANLQNVAAREVAKFNDPPDDPDMDYTMDIGPTISFGAPFDESQTDDTANAQLEACLEKRLKEIEENANTRFERLEAKVDSQLERLFSVMQEIVSGMKADTRV